MTRSSIDFTLHPVSIIRMIKSRKSWARYVARMEDMKNACTVLVRKPEGKGPPGSPRCR
jgi:hypothetical protein